jgi:aspartyl-tRNA(Asn)/glutamyl-tRNA(Gln) amidotransferase subunit A
MADSTLADLTAAELAEQFSRRDLSPVEVTLAVLERIDACEPRVNAMYRIARESALDAARESAQRWRAGVPRSAADGIPVTVKENLYSRGDPAPIGTAAGSLAPRPADAPPVARLREAGCVIVGKTTMPDFGMLSSGLSSIHGITRNPWRTDLNPAGSSSGAAAAAAAGYGPWHLGTDIGGSIRLPAFHCGVFGLKPSLGRVPINPPFLGRVAGPLTRTVHDAALLMNVIAQPDARDFMSLPAEACDYTQDLERIQLAGLRIGLLEDMGTGWPAEPAVVDTVRDAARALERAGAQIEPIQSFLSAAMLDGIQQFFEARSHNELMALDSTARSSVLPFIVEWATWRASLFSGADVMRAYNQIHAMREAAVAASQPFDYLLMPTAPIARYPAEHACPGNDPHRALDHIAFTVAWNMSEQPAAAVNWRFDGEGLPLGVQLVGRRFDDRAVLRLARGVEMLRPVQQPWPPVR